MNNARTVKAIVDGEAPPPPIDIADKNFTDWAFDVAVKEATEEYGRKLTKEEERAMRREIELMQRQLAPMVGGAPPEPQDLSPQVRAIQVQEQERKTETTKILQLAIPALIAVIALRAG